MKLGSLALTAAIALGGCTAREKCEKGIPSSYSCTDISDEATKECKRLSDIMREAAMSACMTTQMDHPMVCKEIEKNNFDCKPKIGEPSPFVIPKLNIK